MLAAGIESGGTLFLDEIANITPGQQAKLLRVLSTGELERVGSSKSRRVDVRVLAATNVDPRPEVAAGRFREDLLYRLNAVGIVIPPLRDRCEDLPVLAAHFLHHHAHRYRKPILGFVPMPWRRCSAMGGPATCGSWITPSSGRCCSRTLPRSRRRICRWPDTRRRRRSHWTVDARGGGAAAGSESAAEDRRECVRGRQVAGAESERHVPQDGTVWAVSGVCSGTLHRGVWRVLRAWFPPDVGRLTPQAPDASPCPPIPGECS